MAVVLESIVTERAVLAWTRGSVHQWCHQNHHQHHHHHTAIAMCIHIWDTITWMGSTNTEMY